MDWKARFEGVGSDLEIRVELARRERPGGINQAYGGFDL